MLTGATFSIIFAAFDLSTIGYALFGTAGFPVLNNPKNIQSKLDAIVLLVLFT